MGDSSWEPAEAPVSRIRARSQWLTGAYVAVFSIYFAGLLLWLAIGLIPSVALAVPPLNHRLDMVASGHGALSGLARSIVENPSMLPSGLSIGSEYLFSVLNLSLGALLAWRRPHDLVPRLLAFAFIGTAATFNEPSHAVFHLLEDAPVVTAFHFTFHVVSGLAYLWAVFLFPDGGMPLSPAGRPLPVGPRRWHRALAAAVVSGVVVWICYRSSFIQHPPFFVAFFGVLVPVVGITAQTLRLHSAASATSRQQSRLLRIALLPALAAAIIWLGARAAELSGSVGSDHAAQVAARVQAVFPAVFAVVPVMLFVAILRYRLWDIDLIVSRSLWFGLLVGTVLVVYVGVLVTAGWLFRGSAWSAVVALTAVALLVEPIRQRCRRMANRLVYGVQLTPRESMRVLAGRLAHSGSRNELAELTAVVVSSTRCSSAKVWLVGDDGRLLLAASTPQTSYEAVPERHSATTQLRDVSRALPEAGCFPVVHEGRLLAVLAVEMPGTQALPRAESSLIGELAGHAGLLVANAQLTTKLARQVATVTEQATELLRSRRLVVAAQDTERRRLERNIHDGAQQDLVTILIQLRALLRKGDRAQIGSEAGRLRGYVRATRATVQDLCTGGRPAVLEDEGLAAALEAAAVSARRGGMDVEVRCRLDLALDARLPADLETGVYFCCLEALQNAAKHARADHVMVDVSMEGDELLFSVRDDGTGFDPTTSGGGSGLGNLVERLAALGGTLQVESAVNAGTRMSGRIPLMREPMAGRPA